MNDMLNKYLYNLKRIKEVDPAAKSILERMFLYPHLYALFFYRIGHGFYSIKLFFIARLFSQIGRLLTGIEIHPGAKIGKGLVIDHGIGVVIGETAIIGDDCLLYHGVTLGANGKDTIKRHPTIKNNVMIGTNAIILGNITIGNNVQIGANCLVNFDVEDNLVVYGLKAEKHTKPGDHCLIDNINRPTR